MFHLFLHHLALQLLVLPLLVSLHVVALCVVLIHAAGGAHAYTRTTYKAACLHTYIRTDFERSEDGARQTYRLSYKQTNELQANECKHAFNSEAARMSVQALTWGTSAAAGLDIATKATSEVRRDLAEIASRSAGDCFEIGSKAAGLSDSVCGLSSCGGLQVVLASIAPASTGIADKKKARRHRTWSRADASRRAERMSDCDVSCRDH